MLEGGETRRDLDLILLGRLIWSELPLMAVINLMVVLSGTLVLATAIAFAPIAPLVGAILLGPVWVGATVGCSRLLAGDASGIGDLCRDIRQHALTGIRLALVPAVVVAVLMGSLAVESASDGQDWLLLPIAVDVMVLILLLFGSITAFTLAVATELHGRERWLAALVLAGRNLTVCLGIGALVVLLLLSVTIAGPFLALIAAGPLCLMTTAATRTFIDGPDAENSTKRRTA